MVRNAAFVVLSAVVLFSSAGRVDWVLGWVFVGLMAISKATTVPIVLRTCAELIPVRFQARGDTRIWDRPLSGIIALWGPIATWLVAGLDVRYGWSQPLPLWMPVAAVTIALLGSLLATWAMASNPDFAATTRIRPRPEQRVATGSPYAKVRHPGYAGFLLFTIATPFVLGSLCSLLPAVLTYVVVFVRTTLEGRTLREELDGYSDYAGRVRYRLLPGYGSYALRPGEADLDSAPAT